MYNPIFIKQLLKAADKVVKKMTTVNLEDYLITDDQIKENLLTTKINNDNLNEN